MFDSWAIALAILPVLVLDFCIHRTGTRKVMMGLLVMLLVVQALVVFILGIKFMLFEEESSYFLESLKGPESSGRRGFVDQVKASYTDISAGNIASGVKSLRYSASKALVDQVKTVHHSLRVDKTMSQYLHVTDLISLFGDKKSTGSSGSGSGLLSLGEGWDEEWRQQSASTVIHSAFGVLPNTTFPDLLPVSSQQVRASLPGVFSAIPATGFSEQYLNPCWEGVAAEDEAAGAMDGDKDRDRDSKVKKVRKKHGSAGLHCLPAFYLLGQPKGGTTDLYSRLTRHHDIHAPGKKEVGQFISTLISSAHNTYKVKEHISFLGS